MWDKKARLSAESPRTNLVHRGDAARQVAKPRTLRKQNGRNTSKATNSPHSSSTSKISNGYLKQNAMTDIGEGKGNEGQNGKTTKRGGVGEAGTFIGGLLGGGARSKKGGGGWMLGGKKDTRQCKTGVARQKGEKFPCNLLI